MRVHLPIFRAGYNPPCIVYDHIAGLVLLDLDMEMLYAIPIITRNFFALFFRRSVRSNMMMPKHP